MQNSTYTFSLSHLHSWNVTTWRPDTCLKHSLLDSNQEQGKLKQSAVNGAEICKRNTKASMNEMNGNVCL